MTEGGVVGLVPVTRKFLVFSVCDKRDGGSGSYLRRRRTIQVSDTEFTGQVEVRCKRFRRETQGSTVFGVPETRSVFLTVVSYLYTGSFEGYP